MNLIPDEDELAIIAAVEELVERAFPRERIRARAAERDAAPPDVWASVAEIGLFGLGLAEDHGGVGLGLAQEALAYRELGRGIASGPFLACSLAARVAAHVGDASLLGELLEGGTQVGLGVLRAGATLQDGVLRGDIHLIDATAADLVLVVHETETALFGRADLGAIAAADSIDPGVRLEKTTVPGATAVARVAGPDLRTRALVLSAAYLAGTAEAARDMSVSHAKVREQFGRPIGVNQAIKHRCADMAVQAEAATSQALYAAAAEDARFDDARFQAEVAIRIAGQAAVQNSQETIQVLGGIGFTWEHDAHLSVKRARLWTSVFGADAGRALILAQEPA